MLFLPKVEGARSSTHSKQSGNIVQRYLTGPKDVVWNEVTISILRRTADLGLDTTLFLMD